MNKFPRAFFVTIPLALMAMDVAQAHFTLIQPASALATENGGKGAPPCGEGTDSNAVTQVQGGHPLPVRLTEFIYHPGHYRFALSVNSRAELPPDPDVVQKNGVSISAPIQSPAKAPVLADGVFVHTAPQAGDFQTSLTLPNLSCDRCTLQVIEFMAEHGANPGGGFYYHHCADLKITADPNLPPADAAWPRAAAQNRAAFPHIAVGGGWKTAITLVNLSAAAVPVKVAFHGDDGSALSLLIAASQKGATQTSVTSAVSAVIDPNATLLLSTEDQLAATVAGWADVQSTGPLGGFAIFHSIPDTGPASEGTVPLQALPTAVTIPFDNTGGSVMAVALSNPSTASANITATIWDDSGNQIGIDTVTIAASGHMAFVLPDQIKLTAGKRGLVRFQAGAGGISGFALRFSALGTFTSVPTL